MTATTFKSRQRVTVQWSAGRVEPATIIRPQKGDPLYPKFQAVRFDDGAKLMVPADALTVQ